MHSTARIRVPIPTVTSPFSHRFTNSSAVHSSGARNFLNSMKARKRVGLLGRKTLLAEYLY